MPLTQQTITELQRLLSAANVLTTKEDLIPYSFDGTAALQQMPGAVIFASSTEQVASVLGREFAQRREISERMSEVVDREIKRLIDEFGLTHEAAAQAVGRSRSAVSNLLRLTQLAKAVQDYLSSGELDMGHARALLGLPVAQQAATRLAVFCRMIS